MRTGACFVALYVAGLFTTIPGQAVGQSVPFNARWVSDTTALSSLLAMFDAPTRIQLASFTTPLTDSITDPDPDPDPDTAALLEELKKLQAAQAEQIERQKAYTEIKARWWRPVRSQQDADIWFGGAERLSTLRQVVISGVLDRSALAAELIGHNQNALGIRLAAGALVSTIDNDAEEEVEGEDPAVVSANSIERFFAAGGNLYITAAYPLVNFGNPESDARLVLYALPRLAGEVPALGSDLTNTTVNADLSVELHASWPKETTAIHLFAQMRAGRIVGTSEFYSNIGVPDEWFGFGQWYAGVRILGYSIGAKGMLFGPIESEQVPVRLTVQVLPFR